MILTLAIPTYRRPELLHKALHAIARQIDGRADVGIAVYDDSDGAANAPVIERLRQQFPRTALDYRVNPANLGIDENIKQCLMRPKSEYVWLLGEDDLLTDGAVDKVMQALERERPVFLFANYIYCDDRHARFARHAVLPEQPGARRIRFDDFASRWIWALGFIGGCVVRAADWRRQPVERYRGSYYSHVGGIVDAAVGGEIVVVGDVLVLNRAEDVNTFTWSRSTFDVYFSFYSVLRASRLAENPRLLAACESAAARLFAVGSLSWLAAKRADGVFDHEAFDAHYATNPFRGRAWKLGARLVAVFPRAPLRWLRRAHLRQRFSREAI
jgi:GT2 family glycosyltransferase